jgi:hypothetical protein
VSPRMRVLILLLIMASTVVITDAISIGILYHTAIEEQRSRLQETTESEARMIEAVARFNELYTSNYPHSAWQATLDQIKDAHANYRGFGKTGEFTLSTRKNDQIVFLLSHRHYDLDNPKPVPWDSDLAEPMRRALSGRSGTIIGLDYRGQTVLAAYEPVAELNLGIVAKIDLSEIRAPFIKASLLSGLSAIAAIILGAGLFLKITNPILRKLNETVTQLSSEVKTLRGILPICSFCKRVRNDKGYWDQVEVYVRQHSEAEFSHSVCPDCLKEHYSDLNGKGGESEMS